MRHFSRIAIENRDDPQPHTTSSSSRPLSRKTPRFRSRDWTTTGKRNTPTMALRFIKRLVRKSLAKVGDGISHSEDLVDRIAYRVALETMLDASASEKTPSELFSGVSDGFWFWLYTEGLRRSSLLRAILPSMPDEDVQLLFTGDTGDSVLSEAFSAYKLFKGECESHVGPIADCSAILDFGCGWGRILRFFLKDIDPSRLWGADPTQKLIDVCKQTNKWGTFQLIGRKPPTPFADNTFDFIYSFSVFSHLSEERQSELLAELSRILKPGGVFVATTRGRDFIEFCAELRKRRDLDSMHEGPKSSALGFPDTQAALSDFDDGKYCFTSFGKTGDRSYWGEAAIPETYVREHWTQWFTFLDYIDDRTRCTQNAIVVQKP